MNMKNALIKTTAVAVCMSLSTFASAVPIKEKYNVLKKAKNYANAVACITTFEKDTEDKRTTANDVYLIDTDNFGGNNEFGSEYLVYWGGDWGCAGGSGTYSYFLSSFTRMTDSRPFNLNKSNILEEVNEDKFEINSRLIESVKVLDGIVSITASAYGNGDSQVAPSERYRYTIVFDSNADKWKLVNKTYLGKVNY